MALTHQQPWESLFEEVRSCVAPRVAAALELPYAKDIAKVVIDGLFQLDDRTFNRLRRKYRVKHLAKAQGPRPARLRRADARNLELLSFVVERITPFAQFMDERLDEEGKDIRLLPGHRDPKVARLRQALAEEWNRTHPHWLMSSGNVLMGQFYRAVDREHLCLDFLRQVDSGIAEVLEDLRATADVTLLALDQIPKEEGGKPPEGPMQISEEVARLIQQAAQDFSDATPRSPRREEFRERIRQREAKYEEEWRSSISLGELCAIRLLRGSLMRDKDPQKEQQLRTTPLRDWFLPEARGEPMQPHWAWWLWKRVRDLRRDERQQGANARG